ncbi:MULTISPECIES: aldehyde dehydrogenase family protein [Vibrio]|uniref:aldehyde dehydrogenase family protein n=1 Tax=Vibrio TaxID=662 RepID=UPI0022B7E118|nr:MULTISPECIES: aldehyde dehydrogenase family protein [Vibrio]
MNQFGMTIDGQTVQGEMPSSIVLNPANEQEAFTAPVASIAQLNKAVESAKAAYPQWSALSQAQRDGYINKIADVIEQNAGELAEIVVKEQGKPTQLAQMEVGGRWLGQGTLRALRFRSKSMKTQKTNASKAVESRSVLWVRLRLGTGL